MLRTLYRTVLLHLEISMISVADFEYTIPSLPKTKTLVVEGHKFPVKKVDKYTTAWNCSKFQT